MWLNSDGLIHTPVHRFIVQSVLNRKTKHRKLYIDVLRNGRSEMKQRVKKKSGTDQTLGLEKSTPPLYGIFSSVSAIIKYSRVFMFFFTLCILSIRTLFFQHIFCLLISGYFSRSFFVCCS